MMKDLKTKMNADIKKIRRRYRIMKIKYFFLFVLPILLIVLAYQTAKQYLKLRLQKLKIDENANDAGDAADSVITAGTDA